jgi:hypothetical protein
MDRTEVRLASDPFAVVAWKKLFGMPQKRTFKIALKNVLQCPTACYNPLLISTFYHFCPHLMLDSPHVKRKIALSEKKLWIADVTENPGFCGHSLCSFFGVTTTFCGGVLSSVGTFSEALAQAILSHARLPTST